MSSQPTAIPAPRQISFLGIVAIGVFVALVTVLTVAEVRPVILAFALGGTILLLPSLAMRDPRAYWLFLLVLSIPFDVSKRTTTWLMEPWRLFQDYGLPASGTLSLDFYLTDVVLIVMLLPWAARLCLRRDKLYFPKFAYIFVVYLAWAMIISLLSAVSFYLSIFEWCRELLYFLFFLYIINNVITRSQLHAIILALMAGLVIESGAVITFFALGIGTETSVFSGLYGERTERTKAVSQNTLYETKEGTGSQTKRSAGTFSHPAHAAYYLEYVLMIVLSFLVTTQRTRDRIFIGTLFALGCLGLYLTFSRTGLVSLVFGCAIFFAVARWSRLVSQRVFRWSVFLFALGAALAAPVLIHFLLSRPETFSYRLGLLQTAFDTFLERPISGAGLNNSSAVMEGSHVSVEGGRRVQLRVVHNYYLIMLIEVGLVGVFLYFSFFAQAVIGAFRSMRAADTERKLILVGIVAALASIAVGNLAEPFGGHAIHAMLWLYAALSIAIARSVHTRATIAASVASAAQR